MKVNAISFLHAQIPYLENSRPWVLRKNANGQWYYMILKSVISHEKIDGIDSRNIKVGS